MNLNESLYTEHLEELSILYDQRLMLDNNESVTWYGFYELEQRVEPHIDALVVGGELALAVCEQRVLKGDAGEIHGALRVIGRQNRKTLLEDLVASLDLSDPALFRAVCEALCQDLHKDCVEGFVADMLLGAPDHIRLAARLSGYRRLNIASDLFDALRRHPEEKAMTLDILYALGRLRPRYGSEHLLNLVHSSDKEIVNGAVTALVRVGERRALEECMSFIGPGDWPKMSLGLYGGKDALTDTFFSVSDLDEKGPEPWDLDHVTAAGLLGNVRLVPDLISCLDNERLSERSALALHMITGADLMETVFVPETIDPDELFEDERVLWEKGRLYPEGTHPGVHVTRLSRSSAQWTEWWIKERVRFDAGTRYRNGKPYSPLCLLETLKSLKSPEIVRSLAHDELVIRYGIDVPFEPTMSVSRQLRMLEALMLRLSGNPDRFVDGLWYFNGRPMKQAS